MTPVMTAEINTAHHLRLRTACPDVTRRTDHYYHHGSRPDEAKAATWAVGTQGRSALAVPFLATSEYQLVTLFRFTYYHSIDPGSRLKNNTIGR